MGNALPIRATKVRRLTHRREQFEYELDSGTVDVFSPLPEIAVCNRHDSSRTVTPTKLFEEKNEKKDVKGCYRHGMHGDKSETSEDREGINVLPFQTGNKRKAPDSDPEVLIINGIDMSTLNPDEFHTTSHSPVSPVEIPEKFKEDHGSNGRDSQVLRTCPVTRPAIIEAENEISGVTSMSGIESTSIRNRHNAHRAARPNFSGLAKFLY